MNTQKSKAIRPEVVVAGDPVRAPEIAGLLVRRKVRCASYVPDFAGGSAGFGLGAFATSARVIVETLDYPIDAKRALLDEILDAVQPGTLIISSALAMTAEEVAVSLNGYDGLAVYGMLEVASPGVEIAVPGAARADVLSRAADFWRQLSREPVEVGDTPGLVTPRIVSCVVNEAAWALGEGIASPEDIDLAMKLGASHPDGPLRRGDRIGLHRIVAVLQNLQDFYGEERYRPAPVLRRMVLRGRMGQEYGAGFYEYPQSAAEGNGQGR